MYSATRSSIKLAIVLFTATAAWAQLPDNPGKAETLKACKECHEIERSIAPRQDRTAWATTVDKMIALGAKISDNDYDVILDYLAKSFPAAELPKLNVNTALAIDFESRLTLPRSQAAAIIEYRTKNGPFKSVEDFKKVPGVDVSRIEARKDKIVF
jgi:competence protein ComEA